MGSTGLSSGISVFLEESWLQEDADAVATLRGEVVSPNPRVTSLSLSLS